ncbi:MAG: ABC transporter permease [Hyphomicrobiaceae bacterium]
MDLFWAIVGGLIVAATPLVFAALGELVVEKSGVLNLGVEGMMVIGAIAGLATKVLTGSYVLAFIAAIVAGALMAGLFGVLTQMLLSNQVATGLALTLFGLGVSSLVGQSFSGKTAGAFPKLPVLEVDVVAGLSLVMVAVVAWWLSSTRGGMILRAVGENHDAAHAVGYKVVRVRMMALLFGGAMAGMGGAYLSLVQTPFWAEKMTAGRGWIALALVVFAAWQPVRVLTGALLFGGITIVQLHAQGFGLKVDAQLLSMLPYLATIAVLVLISRESTRFGLRAPQSLGKTFYAVS